MKGKGKKISLYIVFYNDRPCDLSPLVCQNLHENGLKVGQKMKKRQ